MGEKGFVFDLARDPKKSRPRPSPPARKHEIRRTPLVVGAADDPMEREADRIADEVARSIASSGFAGRAGPVDGAPSARIRRSIRRATAPAEGAPVSEGVVSRIQRARGGGRPFDGPVRSKMESALGVGLGGVRIQRKESRGNNALASALEFDDVQACRDELGEQQFQALNSVWPIRDLEPIFASPEPVATATLLAMHQRVGGATHREVGQRVAQVLQALVGVVPMDMLAILSAAETDFVLAAMDRPLAWRVLDEETLNIPRATARLQYLMPYANDDAQLALADRTLQKTNDVALAGPLMRFLVQYMSADPRRLACAEAQYHAAGGDTTLAAAEVASLAKFQYDRDLRAAAELAATGVADAKLATATAAASAKRQSTIDSLPEVPYIKAKSSKARKLEHASVVAQNDTATLAAKQLEQQELGQAAAAHAGDRQQALTASEQLLATLATRPAIGEPGAKWVLEAVAFDTALATIAADGFGPAAPDPTARPAIGALIAAAGGNAAALRRGVDALVTARAAAGADESTATAVAVFCAGFAGTLRAADVTVLTVDRLAHTSEWLTVCEFVDAHRDACSTAVAAIPHARATQISLGDITMRAKSFSISNVNWILSHAGANKAAVDAAFDLLALKTVTGGRVTALTWLMTLVGTPGFSELVNAIAYREPPLARVQQVVTPHLGTYTLLQLAKWVGGGPIDHVEEALQETAYDPFPAFVDEYMVSRGFGDSVELVELIRLQACLKAGLGVLAVFRRDGDYQRPDHVAVGTYTKRTGFLRLTGQGGTIVVHTHWNTAEHGNDPVQKLLSMHVQLAGTNSLEINKYNHFSLTQRKIKDAHNAATGILAPTGGALELRN
jgi:hypothetical protein